VVVGVLKRVFGWVGRKALLYVMLVLAIWASMFFVPWIKTEWNGPQMSLDRAARLDAAVDQLRLLEGNAQARLSRISADSKVKTLAELDMAIKGARHARGAAIAGRRSALAKAASLARADGDALLADGARELEIQVRSGEITGLLTARTRLEKKQAASNLIMQLRDRVRSVNQSAEKVRQSRTQCRNAARNLKLFEDRWLVWVTGQRYDRARHRLMQQSVHDRCDEARRVEAMYDFQRRGAEEVKRQRDAAYRQYRQSQLWTETQIATVTQSLSDQIVKERTSAEGSWRAKVMLWSSEMHLPLILKIAALALIGIIAMPFLIRLFCYFILAPLAMRRPAIRLRVPGGTGVAIPLGDRSKTSVGVRLAPGEELLVRQDYLQTSSHVGAKGTQWFLDWLHPVTSIATGLTFLTRVRGDGEVTTVSAVHDPFAEVTILTLPEGAACVLQPRALAAVAQPIRRRLRVTGHWRLFSLNAWATMQLRYLVFHGPARLVLKGGRGVRVERAERGRVFGQDQLVGFSADLAYSVTRTETIWPYLFGYEQLLKDRVEAGDGILIVEEAPMAGRRPGEVKRGIEGMIDAGMKVFGM
jgi:uncharacterized protein (AIM24 family)